MAQCQLGWDGEWRCQYGNVFECPSKDPKVFSISKTRTLPGSLLLLLIPRVAEWRWKWIRSFCSLRCALFVPVSSGDSTTTTKESSACLNSSSVAGGVKEDDYLCEWLRQWTTRPLVRKTIPINNEGSGVFDGLIKLHKNLLHSAINNSP